MERSIEKANRPENVARLLRQNEAEYGRLVLDEDGLFLLKGDKREWTLRWADVRRVATYKHDFFAYDMICLGFETGDEQWIEIWEAMVDFSLVSERMQTEFPTIPADWYVTVMLPPFEANYRVLWQCGDDDEQKARTNRLQ